MKKSWKNNFSAFGKILVLATTFFLFKILFKKYSEIDFFSFWQDLGFGGCFFLLNFNFKNLGTLLFRLLARSWFCRLLLSIRILMKQNWKIDFFSFWQNLGFGGCFFSIQILIKKNGKIDFFRFWQNIGFDGCFFSIQILIEKV